MKEKKNKDKKRDLKNILVKTDGITLVALIITIIVLIILATVSINMVLGDEGIIVQARLTAQKQENSTIAEEKSVNELLVIYENAYENVKEGIGKVENTVSYCSTSTVSYYADVDGDGTVDGIIFADLAIGGSGTWAPSSSYSYSYDAVDSSSLKEYTISENTYTDDYFGEGYVITPVTGTTGEDRFYVMALEDETANSDSTASDTTRFCWWYSASSTSFGGTTITDYSTVTSTSFGSGLTNSSYMKAAWEAETYGTQNYSSSYDDMWSLDNIGANVGDSDSVWFVPSYYEWIVFGGAFDIETTNYWSKLGLSGVYWASTLRYAATAYCINFDIGGMVSNGLEYSSCGFVRLATTF